MNGFTLAESPLNGSFTVGDPAQNSSTETSEALKKVNQFLFPSISSILFSLFGQNHRTKFPIKDLSVLPNENSVSVQGSN